MSEGTCAECRHFEPDEYVTLPWKDRSGVCDEIEDHIDINLNLGWEGGNVSFIEVPGDFGCNKFEAKEKEDE